MEEADVCVVHGGVWDVGTWGGGYMEKAQI